MVFFRNLGYSWPNSVINSFPSSNCSTRRGNESKTSASSKDYEDFKNFDDFHELKALQVSVEFRDSSESRSSDDSKASDDCESSRHFKDSGSFDDFKFFLEPGEVSSSKYVEGLGYESDQDAFYDEDYGTDSASDEDSKKEIVASTSEVIAPKTCLICGDPTNCCHYGKEGFYSKLLFNTFQMCQLVLDAKLFSEERF